MKKMAPALILVDLQRAIDDPRWRKDGERNNFSAEQNIADLLQAWRSREWPIFHIRHDSREADSAYRPGQSGNQFKDFATPRDGEMVIPKRTNSAFIGTDLEAVLRGAGHEELVVCGVITNNSVEATVRMAGNLEFRTFLVEDGCYTFGKRDRQGRLWTAEEVHALSLANLDGEYCRVIQAADTLTLWA